MPDEFEMSHGEEAATLRKSAMEYDTFTDEQRRRISEWMYHTYRHMLHQQGVPEAWLVEACPEEKFTDEEREAYFENEDDILELMSTSLQTELTRHLESEATAEVQRCGITKAMYGNIQSHVRLETCQQAVADAITAGSVTNQLTPRNIHVYTTLEELLGLTGGFPIDAEEAQLTQMFAELSEQHKRHLAEWLRHNTYQELLDVGVPAAYIQGFDVTPSLTDDGFDELFEMLEAKAEMLSNNVHDFQSAATRHLLRLMGVPSYQMQAVYDHAYEQKRAKEQLAAMLLQQLALLEQQLDPELLQQQQLVLAQEQKQKLDLLQQIIARQHLGPLQQLIAAGALKDIFKGQWPAFVVPETYQELLGLPKPKNYDALLAFGKQ